jgi:hypothetical protein
VPQAAPARQGYQGYDLKPVKLEKIQGIDPQTIRDADASMIQPIGKFRNETVPPLRAGNEADPDQDDIPDEDTVAFGGEDGAKPQFPAPAPLNEPSEPMLTASAFKIKSLDKASEMIQKSPAGVAALPAHALFPPEVGMHYAAKPGEKLALTCDFNVPLNSRGTLLITNKRVLAVYQRHSFKLFPPQVTIESRRNSVRLRQIDDVSVTGSNRPLLLAIGAAAAWIPAVGVVISGICIAGFFFWTRPDLQIRLENQISRTYPLNSGDLSRAQLLIEKARQQLSTRRHTTHTAHKAS